MNKNKQKVTRIKNEINKKKLNAKNERQKRIDRHWYILSKLKMMGRLDRCQTTGH